MKKNGFTIIEIAMALLVMGLVIVFALKGYNLVLNARVKRELGRVENIITSVNVHYDKYKYLPGDNATSPDNRIDSGNPKVYEELIDKGLASESDFYLNSFNGKPYATWRFAQCQLGAVAQGGGAKIPSAPTLFGQVCIYPAEFADDLTVPALLPDAMAPWFVASGYELFYDDVNLLSGNGRGLGTGAGSTSPSQDDIKANLYSDALLTYGDGFYAIKVWSF